MCELHVFFVKQKAAYELRISDWSSDVCSSDLVVARFQQRRVLRREAGIDGRDAGPERLGAHAGAGQRLVLDEPREFARDLQTLQIGRASCRARVCQYVYISVVAVSSKNKQIHTQLLYYIRHH